VKWSGLLPDTAQNAGHSGTSGWESQQLWLEENRSDVEKLLKLGWLIEWLAIPAHCCMHVLTGMPTRVIILGPGSCGILFPAGGLPHIVLRR
jgi:hypothetical protein